MKNEDESDKWLDLLSYWLKEYKQQATVEWLAVAFNECGFFQSAERLLNSENISHECLELKIDQEEQLSTPAPMLTKANISCEDKPLPVLQVNDTVSSKAVALVRSTVSNNAIVRKLAVQLGIDFWDIEVAHTELDSRCHALLKEWKQINGSAATYQVLITALENIEEMALRQILTTFMGNGGVITIPVPDYLEHDAFSSKFKDSMSTTFIRECLQNTENMVFVGVELGLEEINVRDIERRCTDSDDRWTSLLTEWLEKKGLDANYRSLIIALFSCGYKSAAEALAMKVLPSLNHVIMTKQMPQAAAVSFSKQQVSDTDTAFLVTQYLINYSATSIERVALELELPPGKVDDVLQKESFFGRWMSLLKLWKSEKASQATFTKLISAFESLDENVLAGDIKSYAKSKSEGKSFRCAPKNDKTPVLSDLKADEFSRKYAIDVDRTTLATLLNMGRSSAVNKGHNEDEKMYNFMQAWKQSKGSSATLGWLRNALFCCGANDAGEWIQKEIEKQS